MQQEGREWIKVQLRIQVRIRVKKWLDSQYSVDKGQSCTAAETARKMRREQEFQVLRNIRREKSPCDEEAELLSDEGEVIEIEDDQEMCYQSEPISTEGLSMGTDNRKRKRYDKCGKPPTTEEYVGLAEAMRALNEQKKERERLEHDKKIRLMSSQELLSNMGVDLDDAVDELK